MARNKGKRGKGWLDRYRDGLQPVDSVAKRVRRGGLPGPTGTPGEQARKLTGSRAVARARRALEAAKWRRENPRGRK